MKKINILNFSTRKDFKKEFFNEHHDLFETNKDLSIVVVEEYIYEIKKALENIDLIYIDNPKITAENNQNTSIKYEKIDLTYFTNLLNSNKLKEEDFNIKLRDNIHGVHSFFYLHDKTYILRQTVKEFIIYENNLFKISSKINIKKKVFTEILNILDTVLIEIFEDDFMVEKYIKLPTPSTHRKYSKEIVSVFRGDIEVIDLIHYFSEEFTITDNRASALTKYNQIYFYINDLVDGNAINKESYKKFIRETFCASYNPTKINNLNQDHQNTLYKLAKNFGSNS